MFLPLLNRELGAYFLGPMAYLVLLAFQFIAISQLLGAGRHSEPAATRALEPARPDDHLHLRQPGVLDRDPGGGSHAHHAVVRRGAPSGTIETLLTVPVTETEVVVAKWLAGVVMYCVLLVPFALYLPFLYYQAKFDFDLGPILTLGLGLTTMGMMFIAIGLFLSALTRNQIIAAIWTFVVLFLMVVIVPVRLSVRGAAAHPLGRRRPVRRRALPDSELRPGPARPSLPRPSSFGLRFHALLDGEGARDAHQPLNGERPRGDARFR